MGKGTQISTTVILEIEVEVEGTYHSGSPAITGGGPDKWEPEDPDTAEVELVYSTYRAKKDYMGKTVRLGCGLIYPKFTLDVLEAMSPGFIEMAEDALISEACQDVLDR